MQANPKLKQPSKSETKDHPYFMIFHQQQIDWPSSGFRDQMSRAGLTDVNQGLQTGLYDMSHHDQLHTNTDRI